MMDNYILSINKAPANATRGRAINWLGDTIITAAGIHAVLADDATEGEAAALVKIGTVTEVEVGNDVTAGDYLKPTTAGAFIPAVSTDVSCVYCLEDKTYSAGTGADNFVYALIMSPVVTP